MQNDAAGDVACLGDAAADVALARRAALLSAGDHRRQGPQSRVPPVRRGTPRHRAGRRFRHRLHKCGTVGHRVRRHIVRGRRLHDDRLCHHPGVSGGGGDPLCLSRVDTDLHDRKSAGRRGGEEERSRGAVPLRADARARERREHRADPRRCRREEAPVFLVRAHAGVVVVGDHPECPPDAPAQLECVLRPRRSAAAGDAQIPRRRHDAGPGHAGRRSVRVGARRAQLVHRQLPAAGGVVRIGTAGRRVVRRPRTRQPRRQEGPDRPDRDRRQRRQLRAPRRRVDRPSRRQGDDRGHGSRDRSGRARAARR